jgi:hypothetical protein
VSYFRPQQAGKIGPRTVHSFSDSTLRLSQNAGQVIPAECALSECLKLRVQSTGNRQRSKYGEYASNLLKVLEIVSAPGEIRTPDLLVRRVKTLVRKAWSALLFCAVQILCSQNKPLFCSQVAPKFY